MPIPVDFEKRVKLPDADGYPYSLKAEDLMRNFAWCDLLPSAETDSIRVELDEQPGKTAQHKQRRLRVVGSSSSHPWKVTDNGDGTVSIAAGFILGQYMTNTSSAWGSEPAGPIATYPPETVVLGFGASYEGGYETITGTQYIYAEVARNGTTAVYSQSISAANDNVVVQLGDDIEPSSGDLVSIVISESPPLLYTPTSGNAAVCIAKAVGATGITITQYITHNPTLFIPVVNVISAVAIP